MVRSAIRSLHKNGHPLNTMALLGNPRITELVRKNLNFHITGRNLVKRGRTFFGSWDEALRAAGFEPCRIRKKRPLGVQATTSFLPEPAGQPDALLERKEIATSIDRALSELSQEQQQTTERVLEGVLSLNHFDNRQNLIEQLHRHLDGNFEAEKIAATLDGMSERLKMAA
jgi:hypothetical protein